MIRSKRNMGLFFAALALLLHLAPGAVKPGRAQSSRKDDIVFNSRGTPLAGATVRVCAMPATGQPCAPLANIYSDPALTQALANPTATDGLGNYFFYAAPGKYEIEVSGAGITTKQIPNVILPNDPTSPTFTGGISAFSLNLTGNLTVNGNTTVLGNLASGTLNLSNQSTPPGAASAGTVNLYTKSADKKLYYKDETGTETGPLNSGGGGSPAGNNGDLQSRNGTVLGASGLNDNGTVLAVARDIQDGGPNPNFDIRAFGGYIAASLGTMTCSMTSGSPTLTCTSNPDFKDATGIPGSSTGHGVFVPGAGALPTIVTPGTPTVTPNLLNGVTTWNYKLIAEDFKGGLTAATVAGTTTTGSTAMGLTSFTITTATRSNGVSTYTTSANHNLQAGMTVLICQFGGGSCPGSFGDLFNGTKVVSAVPSSTTFQTVDSNISTFDATEAPASGQGWVRACNTLTFPANSFSGQGTLRYWVYRSQGAGAYSLVGVAMGMDPFFQDCGGAAPTAPSYVPATPPASAQAGYLSTTISSGGGTTTLTLAANAGTSVTNVTVSHDNAPNLLAAMNAAYNKNGGTVFFPAFTGETAGTPVYWAFSASTDMTSVPSQNNNPIHIGLLINGHISLSNPWILRTNTRIEGMPKTNDAFSYTSGAKIGGASIPLFYTRNVNSVTLRNVVMEPFTPQGTSVLIDGSVLVGGANGVIFENVGMGNLLNNGNSTARNLVIKGGFDYYFRQFTCLSNIGTGATSYLPAPCVDLTDQSVAVDANSQVPGRLFFDAPYFVGSGVRLTSTPNGSYGGGGTLRFVGGLFESGLTPYLRVGPIGYTPGLTMEDIAVADQVTGVGTPIVDASGSQLQNVKWVNGLIGANSQEPIVVGALQAFAVNYPTNNFGSGQWFAPTNYLATPIVELGNQPLAAIGSGRVTYQMAPPGAPSGCVVSAGGAVPVGAHTYQLTALDFDNAETLRGPSVSVTTTTGNQTVTCNTPAFPSGAKGFDVYRDAVRANVGSCPATIGPPQVAGASFADSQQFACGNSSPNVNSAGSSFLSSNGLTTYQLRLNGAPLTGTAGTGTLAATSRGSSVQGHLPTFDAGGNLVDAGIAPTNVTDFFNRAAGNLGSETNSPWTVETGTLLVTAGGVGGNTTGQNYAVFTGVGFPNDDQTVSATWVKSGAPTVQVNSLVLRGSPSALTNYLCQPANNGASLTISKWVSGTFTSLVTQSATINSGDIVSFNVSGSSLNCYVNGVLIVSAADSSITSGFPGVGSFQLYNTNAANVQWKNWMASPGYVSLQRPQTWSQVQTFTPGVTIGSEQISAAPRGPFTAFLPGALTSTWTGQSWTLDKAITVTRVQVQAKTAPAGCTTNAIVRLTDGTTPVNVTVSATANDSGAISQNYAAGSTLTLSVQTAAAGCTTSPADANAVVQFRMQ